MADPKEITQALETLRTLKSFPSPDAVNTTTGPQLPSYVFAPSTCPWKLGHLRSAYGAICCHRFKPENQTEDIFLAQILA